MILLYSVLALAAEPYEHTFPPGEKALDLSASKGTLTLRTGGDAITIRGTHEGDASMCHLATSTENGATAAYKENGSSTIPRDCITNMEVSVPAGTGVHVAIGQGTLDVQLEGSLQGQVATGDVKGRVSGTVNLQVAQGNVALAGLKSATEVKVSQGNAALVFDEAPQGTILVTVAQGGVYIDLPEGSEVDARVPSGVTIPHTQKTSSPTKLMIGRTNGEVLVE
jgi:hypothetical protein